MLSGGSKVSASVIPAAKTVTVQVVPAGRSAVGSSVKLAEGEALSVNVCGEPHCTEKEPVVALTGSVKLTVMLEVGATLFAPFAGEVVVTAGLASTLIVTVAVSFGERPLVAV